jgi:hypothetical protein
MDPDSEPMLDLYSKCLKKEPYTTLSPFSKKSAPIMKQNMRYIYEVCKPELLPYHTAAQILMKKFEHIQLFHVPRIKNSSADALAKLAAALVLPEGEPAQIKI